MLAKIRSAAVLGLEAQPVDVEVDVSRGFASVTLVGLPDAAVRESSERVRAAIRNSGYSFPYDHRITINLAPADLRKEGPAYDLPIAIGVLVASTYTLEEAQDAAFTTGVELVCWTSNQSCLVSGRVAGTYYYRVKGENVWGESNWSNLQDTVVLVPSTPTLYAINNADGDGSYTVDWSDAPRASSYILHIDDNPQFSSPNQVYSGSASQWSTSGQPAGTAYYRVMATGPTGSSEWSNVQIVTVLPPAVPSLNPISNADGDGNYTVSWSSAARATGYQLHEDDNSGFSSPATVYSGASLSWSATNKGQGTWYYRVRATGPTGTSGWSATQSTSVLAPGNIQIVYIFYDGLEWMYEGDEYAKIRNVGGRSLSLSGWRLNAGDVGQNYYFPAYTMQPGQECRVYTDEYHPESCGFNFGSPEALWNNSGDCGYLYNGGGSLVSTYLLSVTPDCTVGSRQHRRRLSARQVGDRDRKTRESDCGERGLGREA